MGTNDDVAKRSKRSADRFEAAELPRALMGGTSAMRDAGTKYLPQFPMETSDGWRARRDSTFLFNAYRAAWQTLIGKAFVDGAQFTDPGAVPAEVGQLIENVDLEGNHFDVFCKRVFGDSLHVGLGHILVETTNQTGRATFTQRQAQALGIRPYWVYVPGDAVLGTRSLNVAGRRTLAQVRISESASEADGRFGETAVNRVRVLRRADDERPFATVEVWREVEGNWVVEVEESTLEPHTEIPLATFYAHKTGFMEARPALNDLAHMNLEHWQSSSDQRNILHFSRVPFYGFFGFQAQEMADFQSIGAGARISSTNAAARVETIEFSGVGIQQGERDLTRIKEEMEVLAKEPLTPGAESVKTATQVKAEELRANSALLDWVRSFEDCVEEAWRITFRSANIPGDGLSIKLARDWSLTDEEEKEARLMMEAWDRKLLTGERDRREVLLALARAARFSTDWSAEGSAARGEATDDGVGE